MESTSDAMAEILIGRAAGRDAATRLAASPGPV
jgi:hypothetical protein